MGKRYSPNQEAAWCAREAARSEMLARREERCSLGIVVVIIIVLLGGITASVIH